MPGHGGSWSPATPPLPPLRRPARQRLCPAAAEHTPAPSRGAPCKCRGGGRAPSRPPPGRPQACWRVWRSSLLPPAGLLACCVLPPRLPEPPPRCRAMHHHTMADSRTSRQSAVEPVMRAASRVTFTSCTALPAPGVRSTQHAARAAPAGARESHTAHSQHALSTSLVHSVQSE